MSGTGGRGRRLLERGAFELDPFEDLLAIHFDCLRGENPEFHLAALLRENFNPDVRSDPKGLPDSSCQYEHGSGIRVGFGSPPGVALRQSDRPTHSGVRPEMRIGGAAGSGYESLGAGPGGCSSVRRRWGPGRREKRSEGGRGAPRKIEDRVGSRSHGEDFVVVVDALSGRAQPNTRLTLLKPLNRSILVRLVVAPASVVS